MEKVNDRLVVITENENVLVVALYLKCCVTQSSKINWTDLYRVYKTPCVSNGVRKERGLEQH